MNNDNKDASDLEQIVSQAKNDMKKLKLENKNTRETQQENKSDNDVSVKSENKNKQQQQQQVVLVKSKNNTTKVVDTVRKPILRIIPLGKNATVDPEKLKAILKKNPNLRILVENTRNAPPIKKKHDPEFENLLALCKHNIMSLYHERTKKKARISSSS